LPLFGFCFLLFIPVIKRQCPGSKKNSFTSFQRTSQTKNLFETDQVLEITLSGSIRELLNDRTGTPEIHHLRLAYRREDSSVISIRLKQKQE